nr:MAG TPA: 4Fe-4S binding domain protein [Caudoviricetes sp.]
MTAIVSAPVSLTLSAAFGRFFCTCNKTKCVYKTMFSKNTYT